VLISAVDGYNWNENLLQDCGWDWERMESFIHVSCRPNASWQRTSLDALFDLLRCIPES